MSTAASHRKIIAISPENYQILSKLGITTDSFNDVITKLIDYIRENKLNNPEIYDVITKVRIPADITEDDFVQVIDSSRKEVSD